MRIFMAGLFLSPAFALAQLNESPTPAAPMPIVLHKVTCGAQSGVADISPMRLISEDELTLGLRVFPGRFAPVVAVNENGVALAKGYLAPSELTKTVVVYQKSECDALKQKFAELVAATKRCGNAILATMNYMKSSNSALISDLKIDKHICL